MQEWELVIVPQGAEDEAVPVMSGSWGECADAVRELLGEGPPMAFDGVTLCDVIVRAVAR